MGDILVTIKYGDRAC